MDRVQPTRCGWLRYFPCCCFCDNSEERIADTAKGLLDEQAGSTNPESTPKEARQVTFKPNTKPAEKKISEAVSTSGFGRGSASGLDRVEVRPQRGTRVSHQDGQIYTSIGSGSPTGSDSSFDSNPNSPSRLAGAQAEYSAWGVKKGTSSPPNKSGGIY